MNRNFRLLEEIQQDIINPEYLSNALIIGDAMAGKTFILLKILLRYYLNEANCMFFASEENWNQIKEKIFKICPNVDKYCKNNRVIFKEVSNIYEIIEILKKHKPDFVAIDSLSSLSYLPKTMPIKRKLLIEKIPKNTKESASDYMHTDSFSLRNAQYKQNSIRNLLNLSYNQNFVLFASAHTYRIPMASVNVNMGNPLNCIDSALNYSFSFISHIERISNENSVNFNIVKNRNGNDQRIIVPLF